MKRMILSSTTINTSLIILILIASPVYADVNKSFTCGVILPLTGEFQILGTEVMHGIECAVDRINTQGGVNGYTFELVQADDMSDPDKASSLFADMKEKGIPVVIGSVTTDLTIPMAKQTKPDPNITTVLISPRANGNDLYGISPGFYQVHSPVFYLGEVVAGWLAYTADRVALVYIDDSYGHSMCDTITSNLENSSSVLISAEIPIIHDDPGYQQTISMILDNISDTVVFIGTDPDVIPILIALNDAGFDGQVILTESTLLETLEIDNTPNIAEKFSLFTINTYTTLVPGKNTEQFVAEYQEKYGKSPEGSVAGYGYDSVMVIYEALLHEKQTENVTAASLMKGLDKIMYYGVTGPKTFDAKNAVSPTTDRYIYYDDTFSLLSQSIL